MKKLRMLIACTTLLLAATACGALGDNSSSAHSSSAPENSASSSQASTIDPFDEAARLDSAPQSEEEFFILDMEEEPASASSSAPSSVAPSSPIPASSAPSSSAQNSINATLDEYQPDIPLAQDPGTNGEATLFNDSSSSASNALDYTVIEQELLRLINQERTAQGIEPLGLEESMRWAARIRAPEVLASLSHTRPDGTPYYTALDEAGFVYAGKWHGENVSYMYFTQGMYTATEAAQKMFQELKDSPGHYQNMLSPNFLQAGVGAYVLVQNNMVQVGSAQIFAGR